MASSHPLHVVIGTSVGPFSIGSSAHYVLGRIKTDPASFPAIHVKYSPTEPLLHPLVVELPSNGLRLNFDAAEQRLRFIEVLDFSKVLLQHNDNAINKPRGDELLLDARAHAGPDFQRIYREFGPANPGEFIGQDGQQGTYCMSFKEGIAFSFPVKAPEGFSKTDLAKVIAVLGSSSCQPATSMVVFRGRSWPLARKDIYSADLSNMFLSPLVANRRDGIPAEVEIAKVQDRGRIELIRRGAPSFLLRIGETTQQDLLIELGPPDTIYRKVNRHSTTTQQRRTSSMNSRRPNLRHLDSDRTSSATSETDGSDAWSDEDEAEELPVVNEFDDPDVGVWWNFYSHGLDILVSQAHQISLQSPTNSKQPDSEDTKTENETIAHNHLTVTKVCIHGNIPGSYQFNRHRRLQWTLDSWPLDQHSPSTPITLSSETKFRDLQAHLRAVFKDSYANELEEKEQQQPLAINRDWGEASSLGNSVELLGGLDIGKKRGDPDDDAEGNRIGEVLVFGFPGLAFEVLKNGAVSTLQVW